MPISLGRRPVNGGSKERAGVTISRNEEEVHNPISSGSVPAAEYMRAREGEFGLQESYTDHLEKAKGVVDRLNSLRDQEALNSYVASQAPMTRSQAFLSLSQEAGDILYSLNSDIRSLNDKKLSYSLDEEVLNTLRALETHFLELHNEEAASQAISRITAFLDKYSKLLEDSELAEAMNTGSGDTLPGIEREENVVAGSSNQSMSFYADLRDVEAVIRSASSNPVLKNDSRFDDLETYVNEIKAKVAKN